jgi:hypothetical protein
MSTSYAPDGTDSISAETQLTRLEAKVDLLLKHLGANAPGNVEESPPLSSPSRREKLDGVRHYARLQGLYDHMLTIEEVVPKFNRIAGDRKPRIWFHDDSYLWYDEWGKLWSGVKGRSTPEERKICEAQKAIEIYALDKQVWRPNFEGELEGKEI